MSRRVPPLRHKQLVPGSRPSSRQRGYTVAWQRRRAAYLRDHPICEHCGRVAATVVDHKKRLTAGGEDIETNYQALCATCHNRKTCEYDGGLGRERKDYPV